MSNTSGQVAKWRSGLVVLSAVLCVLVPQPARAEPDGEARFFQGCPAREPIRVHDDRRAWDLHALSYTALGLSEVEVLRLIDWVIDLPIPGRVLRPCERTTAAIRSGYGRIPPWLLVRRTGELADALQLERLSLGDATAAHSVATGGMSGPGSGMMVRIDHLIDWMQRVTGDLNRLSGCAVVRPGGLITWSMPGRMVDGAQRVLRRTFHHASVLVTRAIDGSLTGVEAGAEAVVNLGRQRSHRRTTVFLRMPLSVYRAHEVWMLEHREHVVLGSPTDFAEATHAELAHYRRRLRLRAWSVVDAPGSHVTELIVMTTTRVLARAPDSLKPYVVPAAWVLNGTAQR